MRLPSSIVSPACMFYRIAQMPRNDKVYHIFKCSSWNLRAHVSVEVSSFNGTWKATAELQPYVQTNMSGWNMKVISVKQSSLPLPEQRFAQSLTEHIMLDNLFKIPVKCPDEHTATKQFRSVTTT